MNLQEEVEALVPVRFLLPFLSPSHPATSFAHAHTPAGAFLPSSGIFSLLLSGD